MRLTAHTLTAMRCDDPTTDLTPLADSLAETLQVSRDLCAGIGAFFITAGGRLRTTFSGTESGELNAQRLRALAESCLSHPAATQRALFATAEITHEPESAERSLACVALPLWHEDARLGVLGVIDTWLPELDDEQRAGLISLGNGLAREIELHGSIDQLGDEDDFERAPDTAHVTDDGPSGEAGDWRAVVVTGDYDEDATDAEIVDDKTGSERHETFLGEVLDRLPDGLLVTRADGAVVMVNHALAEMTGLQIDDLLGEDVGLIVSTGEDQADASKAETAEERTELLLAALGRAPSGRNLLVSSLSGDTVVTEPSGTRLLSRYAGECTVTLLREADPSADQLSQGADQLGSVLNELEDGVICCDADGIVTVANVAARVLQGLPEGRTLVGLPFSGVTALQTSTGTPLAPESHPLLQALRDGTTRTSHLRLAGGDPQQLHIAASGRPLKLQDGRNGAIVVLRDMTAEWTEQEQLAHYALHDPLTGLANRYLFSAELERMLKGLARRGGSVALVFMDLDNFKNVNDEYGHAVGDELLRAIGRRLAGTVRSDDVVARLGGDEFVIAHNSASPLSDGDSMVARIRKVLLAPYLVEGKVFDVRVSLGWVSTTSGEVTAAKLLDEADKAMYGEKRK